MLTWKSKERSSERSVRIPHLQPIYRQFLWYFGGENLCVWFSLLFTRGNGGVIRKLSGFTWGTGARVSYRSHKPRATESVLAGCLLCVCLSVVCFVIDNQVYKVHLKRNCKPIHWYCIQPINTQWFVGKREWVNGGIT